MLSKNTHDVWERKQHQNLRYFTHFHAGETRMSGQAGGAGVGTLKNTTAYLRSWTSPATRGLHWKWPPKPASTSKRFLMIWNAEEKLLSNQPQKVLIWQQLRNFQIFELNTTITELWPKVPKIEISSHVVRWKKRLQSRYQQMIYEVFFSIFTSYKLFNVLVLKL